MARPLRIEYENAFYHITVRGNEKRIIFADDFDRDIFLEIVNEAYKRFSFIIHAFVLMNNHFHFLIETPSANLCSSMRHINGVYTQAYNRRHKRVGHLFQGRYKSIVVDRDAYYLELIRYIHLNPWRAGIVRRLDDFKYSSHKAIVDKQWGRRWKMWYDGDVILREFGRSEGEAIRHYREFVNAGKEMDNPLNNAIGGYALGERSFADWLWQEFLDGRESRELTGVSKIRPHINISKLISAVGQEYGLKADDVFKRGTVKSGSNIGRAMALYIISRHTGMTQREIGNVAGGINRTAVSETVRRFKRLIAEDADIRRRYEQILKKIRCH